MQKKIIALAIASALTAPAAFADTSNVTVYGLLNADVESVSNSLPSAATMPTSKTRITSNASRFGIKGSEDLGDGMSAIWQLETRVNLLGNETTAVAGTTPASTVNLGIFNGLRNSNIGLKGSFGTVFLGHWDTPFKTAHNPIELFDNTTIATATALMGTTTATTVAKGGVVNAAVGYALRQNSSVQYWTPVMNGFQGKFAYSNNATTAATTTQKPSLVSLSLAYDDAQFYAAFAYDNHTDFRGAGLKDSANRLVGAYKFTDGQVGLAYDRLTVATTTASNSTRSAWELSGKYKMGANNFGAFYTKAGSMSGTTATGANQVSLRYGYNFSKRTEAYAMYTAIKNDTNANYGIADVANGYTGVAGSKISGMGFGLVHTF